VSGKERESGSIRRVQCGQVPIRRGREEAREVRLLIEATTLLANSIRTGNRGELIQAGSRRPGEKRGNGPERGRTDPPPPPEGGGEGQDTEKMRCADNEDWIEIVNDSEMW
jgi:hypothetical protein